MLVRPDDMWDPNTWDLSPQPRRIYADDKATTFCLIDEIDYEWVSRHLWCLNVKKSRGNPLKTKSYFRRAVGINNRGRVCTITLYLHLEILKRACPTPPSPQHVIGDHRDGDTMNNRRENLRWATHSMNAKNILGAHPHDLVNG